MKLRQVPLDNLFRNLSRLLRGESMTELAKHQDKLGLQASCINCLHWQQAQTFVGASKPNARHAESKCKKYNLLPPPEVIAISCESWEDVDDIPF